MKKILIVSFFAFLISLACSVSGTLPNGTVSLAKSTQTPLPAIFSPTATNCVVVSVPRLNLRNSPMGPADAAGLYQGDKLTVLDARGGWYRVATSDGRTGWVDADYVRMECK